MEPVRWGVLSTARIGWEKVIPGMQKSAEVKVLGLASRSLERAREWAGRLGIPKVYGSYEALLEDPEIEAVYNPLPNHLHVPFTLEAVRRGKHVLCEKPVALTAREAEALLALPKDRLVAEAFMVRQHPQWLMARDLIRKGELGRVHAVQVFFSYFNTDPANVRNQAGIGGGGLYDIGCYAIVSGRFAFESEPRRVMSLVERDPAFKTDRLTSGLADFGGGRHLTFTVGTQTMPYQRVNILGDKGRFEIDIPFNAPLTGKTLVRLQRAGEAAPTTIEIGEADQYQLQAEAFGRAVRGLAPLPYGTADAVANMRIIDALFRADSSGRWEAVA